MLRMTMHRLKFVTLAATVTVALLVFTCPDFSLAVIQGPCAECHTMHNSQGNQPMTFDSAGTPNEYLLRGTCYGCHAMNEGSSIYNLGTDAIPQVLHTDTTHDLAGGNFTYISPGRNNRGHNISDLTGADDVLTYPPGVLADVHTLLYVFAPPLSCAGSSDLAVIGCHGYRKQNPAFFPDGITGAHHSNVNGQLDQATEPGNSYRFLMGVKGYESPDWERTPGAGNHNEYYGLPAPITMGCSAQGCHLGNDGTKPPDGTMSQFCATCHGNFHTLDNGTSGEEGIGSDAVSPFLRHPTDLSLPGDGEYQFYTTYNNQAPVARTDASIGVPSGPDGTVYPGSDAVMCLSCHRAHASNYPDMLRWDYTTIIAGSGDDTGGCFVCHTTKDDA